MKDIIVVGAGPAGSSTSAFLAKRGYDVLMLDKAKFPRDKPCGDGQPQRTVEFLSEELGILEIMEEKGYRIYGARIFSPDRTEFGINLLEITAEDIEALSLLLAKAEAELLVKDIGKPAFCTPRKILDNCIKDAAVGLGAELVEEFMVTDLIIEGGKVCGVKGKYLGERETVDFRSKLVVGADGSHTVVGRRLGMFPQIPEHLAYAIRAYYKNVDGLTDSIEIYYEKDVLPGYVWIFPVQKDVANVGCIMWGAKYKTLEEHLQKFIATDKRFRGSEIERKLLGWRLPMGGQATKNYTNGALLVGDAASFVDPLSGEGVYPALKSGKIAAEVCDSAWKKDDFSEKTLQDYERKWKSEFEEEFIHAFECRQLIADEPVMNYIAKEASRDKAFAALLVTSWVGMVPKKAMLKNLKM